MERKSNQKGRLEVICGSMFSGKTEELMRRLNRAEYAKQKVVVIKHTIDQRYEASDKNIVSHEGRCMRYSFAMHTESDFNNIVDAAKNNTMVVIGIDEVQFFDKSIVAAIETCINVGARIIVAGLDLDFRGEPFGFMPELMALADEVVKLKAICVVCGSDAHHTQRLIDNKPARYDDPVILVGAAELYEARCRSCFSMHKIQKNMIGDVVTMATL